MSDVPALEATGVSKRYGNQQALRDVDLVARPGRVHGLLGPNGAGKTTLLRIVLGLVQRDAGTVRLLGSSRASIGGPLPAGVAGFVEAPCFYPSLSARRNLAVLARLDDHDAGWKDSRIDDALDQVGLRAHAQARVAGYSAGMRQRLGIAAALLRSPRLLFFDEPTNALDPASARDVRALAQRLADDGAAVVLSSHDMSEVEELCTTLTVLDRGRVIFSGAVEKLRERAPSAVHAMRTSDDGAAVTLASAQPGVKVTRGPEGLEVSADICALDAYVIALGRAGVAVRALEHRVRSLESLFLELTAEPVATS
jgi:ABC-2 type transport system ATP-binding protein